MTRRALPNILVSGTPGTGKTTFCQSLQTALEQFDFASDNRVQVHQIGELVLQKSLHEGRDEEFDSYILDEDKLCDELEPMLGAADGGHVVDFHSCDFFPERWFDLVVVLRTDNTVLYDRLVARGYKKRKVDENIECEIMQVLLTEAHDSYSNVLALRSDTAEDMDENVERISNYIDEWHRATLQQQQQ